MSIEDAEPLSNRSMAGHRLLASSRASGRLRTWLNTVANKREYLERLQLAIQHLHKCGAVWRESVPVHETFRGKTVWRGAVEVFDLSGHPKARRCYAWSHPDGPQNRDEKFVAVLEIPPVDLALTAVRVQIVSDAKRGRK